MDNNLPDRFRRAPQMIVLAGLLILVGLLSACPLGPSHKDIKQAEIEYDLGVGELKSGRVRQAMTHFKQSVDLHQSFAQAHSALGLTHMLLGKSDLALSCFRKALELKPDFAEVENNIARLYINKGRFREAIPHLRKALESVFLTERFLAEGNLGWALFNVGEEEAGIRHVMNALSANEKFCVGYEYLGLMYQKRKAYEEAIREFEQLLKNCPNHTAGHRALAKTLLMTGNVDKGCHHLAVCRGHGRMTPVGRDCDRLFRSTCPKESSDSDP